MKKLLVAAFMLLCTAGLFAVDWGYIQPTFGIGVDFKKGNQFGITAGVDIDYDVWKNDGDAAGDLYVGGDIAFQYWVPTEEWNRDAKLHYFNIPLQANVAYEFQVNAGPLEAVGPWYSMGVSIDIVAIDGESDSDASFVWGLGASLAFTGNWALKAGFGGNAKDGHRDYFMVEAAYRF